MVATKHAHVRANNVLKYLRWRHTDASGQSPDGYRGEVFDLDPQAKLVGVRDGSQRRRVRRGSSQTLPSSGLGVVALLLSKRKIVIGCLGMVTLWRLVAAPS
jgi:hypothetical protein